MTNGNKYTEARANIAKIYKIIEHHDADTICSFYVAGLYGTDEITADEREELFEYNNELFVKKHVGLL